MFRKSMMLALAATVSLGAFALSSSSASAFHPAGGGGGGGVHAVGGGSVKFSGLQSNPHFVTGLKINNKPMVNGIKINPWPKYGHNWNWHYPRYWWWRHTWRRPYWIAPMVVTGGVAAAGASYASTPATNTCTCLTKQYTAQGAVVFKDVCTNEMAMNPPANASPAADAGPQMPQQPAYQQGYLQAPAQGQ
jgi:hypothetical protein